jgi:hypothetical protein
MQGDVLGTIGGHVGERCAVIAESEGISNETLLGWQELMDGSGLSQGRIAIADRPQDGQRQGGNGNEGA